MNKEKILDDYKTGKKQQKQLMQLNDGSLVVGTEIDENNYLHYVIQTPNGLDVQLAAGKHISRNLVKPSSEVVTISIKK